MISWKASRAGTDNLPLFPHAFLHAMATVVSAYFSTSDGLSRGASEMVESISSARRTRLGTRVSKEIIHLYQCFFMCVCAAGVSYGYARFEPSTASYQPICWTRSDTICARSELQTCVED